MSDAERRTREALIGALVELLKERSVADVSVRDVAAAAGVNHGLVHRYFGSKDGLVREAVTRISAQILEGQPPGRGQTAWSFAQLRARPELAVVVARCCLDGPRDLLPLAAPPPARLAELVVLVRGALSRMGLARQVDAHLVNGLATAALLGWFVFRPLLEAGYRIPRDADDQLAALLARVDDLLAAGPT